jgi:hypothetical protein
MGIRRTRNESIDPALNDELDREEWYQAMTLGLDAASLLGVGNTAMSTIRMVNTLKKVTGRNTHQVLKGLNRQERVRLTKEMLSINHPDMTRRMLKLKQMAGEIPKRFTSADVRNGTMMQMLDALGAVSGIAGSVRSGNIRILAIGLYEEISE